MCIFSVVHFQVKSQKAAPAICKKSMEDKSIKVVQRPPNILFHLCSDFVIFVSSHSKPFALNRAIVLFFCAFTFLLWILDQIFLLSELTRPHLITTSNFPSFNLALSRSGESAARPLHNHHHYHHLHHHYHHHYHPLVQVNQQLDLSIPVVGEPAPDCKWTLNGQEVKSGDNVKVNWGRVHFFKYVV